MPHVHSPTTPVPASNGRVPRLSRREALGLLVATPWLAGAAFGNVPQAESLFDGKALGSWKPVSFGGEGEVGIVDGAIRLERGNDLTGIVWTGRVPKASFRLEVEARRVDGSDFFCAVTVPVADSHCTFVAGGWGGTVVGFSSLDGLDASENETSGTFPFVDGRWYRVGVDVTPTHMRGLVDGAVVAEAALAGREVDVRIEMTPCRPLGIASWRTTSDIRAITLQERA